MRVIAHENKNIVISTADVQDGSPAKEATEYEVVAGKLQLTLTFDHTPGSNETTKGIDEETLVAVLLDRIHHVLTKEPCDRYNRALYHLVKAQECFKTQS